VTETLIDEMMTMSAL